MDRHIRNCTALSLLGLLSLAWCQCHGNRVINKQNELNSLSCPTFTGDLTVQSLTPQQTGQSPPVLKLEGLEFVEGNLRFEDITGQDDNTGYHGPAGLNIISAPSLKNVSGTLSFENLQNVAIPYFQELQSANNISFSDVTFKDEAAFKNKNFAPNLNSARSISFVGTTVSQIGPFPDLSLTGSSASVIATNNSQLHLINLSGYSNVDTYISVDGNGPNMTVIFSDVQHAFVRLSKVAAFTAPQLKDLVQSVSHESGFQTITNGTFSTLSLPKLLAVQGGLQIENNENLNKLDLPRLEDIETLEILNNPNLKDISLPKLKEVQDKLDVIGPVNDVVVPSLSANGVTGTVGVGVASGGSFKCSSISLPTNKYTCGAPSKISTATSAPSPSESSTSGASSGHGLTEGATIGIGVGVGVGGALLLAGIIFLCLRRRKSRQRISSQPAKDYPKAEQVGDQNRAEYYNNPTYAFAANKEMHEPPSEDNSPDSAGAHQWSQQNRDIPPDDHQYDDEPPQDYKAELEEQQGMRHEMDARSLPDFEDGDDDEADTRSLEDIERIHGQR